MLWHHTSDHSIYCPKVINDERQVYCKAKCYKIIVYKKYQIVLKIKSIIFNVASSTHADLPFFSLMITTIIYNSNRSRLVRAWKHTVFFKEFRIGNFKVKGIFFLSIHLFLLDFSANQLYSTVTRIINMILRILL